jgi:PelA/Pel-15E family pectate lyase
MAATPPRSLIAALLVGAASCAHGEVRFADCLKQPPEWYATPAARDVAANMFLYQSPEGGWPTDVDTTVAPTSEFLAKKPSSRAPTIDDGATTVPLRFFARVVATTGDETLRDAFLKGFDFLLAAQYPNGGWPQYFPLRKGYHSHITFNDDAMVDVLELLRDASEGSAPFDFVDDERRALAAAAVARGIECILATQIRRGGKLLVWCAQHDAETLEPAWARNFEPPSFSGHESVGVVRFLMAIENPDARVIAAVEGASEWLRGAVVRGLRVERFVGADGKRDVRTLADPDAPPIWARFYDLESVTPIFTGRDRVPRERLDDIEYERRNGYGYLGTWPAKLLEKEYPEWRKKHGQP